MKKRPQSSRVDGRRKLKLEKTFAPLPVDEGDELFPNGIFEFNVTKMLAFISAHPTSLPSKNRKSKICQTILPNGSTRRRSDAPIFRLRSCWLRSARGAST